MAAGHSLQPEGSSLWTWTNGQAEQEASERVQKAHEAHEQSLREHQATQLEADKAKSELASSVHKLETLGSKHEASQRSLAALKEMHAKSTASLLQPVAVLDVTPCFEHTILDHQPTGRQECVRCGSLT